MVSVPLSSSAVAQQSTGTPQAAPAVPCAVQPVGLLPLLAMLNEVGQAQQQQPLGSVDLGIVTRGERLSSEDEAGIKATANELVACANAVSPFQILALISERFQARLVAEVVEGRGMEAVAEQLPMLAAQGSETGGVPPLTITDAWYTPGTNKSIQAVVVPEGQDPSQQVRFLVTFVFSIDRWLVDDIQLITD
jgi:hypothetical protein